MRQDKIMEKCSQKLVGFVFKFFSLGIRQVLTGSVVEVN